MTNHRVLLDVPSVPYGPRHVTPSEADADYYRAAAAHIRSQARRGEAFAGSNLTESVARLCEAASAALERPPAPDVELMQRKIEQIERWVATAGVFDWGIEIRSTETSAIVIYEERDEAACQRFIDNQPLWYTHREGESMRIVKRVAAGPWEAAS